MKRRDFAMGLSATLAASPLLARAQPFDQAWAAGAAVPALGQTEALLILHNGKPIYERYGPDGGPDVRHVSWSMAKSITQALVGIAVGDGRVDVRCGRGQD